MLNSDSDEAEKNKRMKEKGEEVGKEKENARIPPGTEMANECHLTLQPQLKIWSLKRHIFFSAQMWL